MAACWNVIDFYFDVEKEKTLSIVPAVHPETCQTYKIERFAKIVNSYKPLTIFENVPS